VCCTRSLLAILCRWKGLKIMGIMVGPEKEV
jgi:hypothetical protein